MNRAYSVVNGSLLVDSVKNPGNRLIISLCKKLVWLLIAFMIFSITWLIFDTALSSDPNIFNTISLGAVFATLGSTMVSISSLACNKNYEEFLACLSVLKDDLASENIDIKWTFLKKKEKIKKCNKLYITYQTTNPKIVFEMGNVNLPIEFPTQKRSFYELEILKSIVNMKISKKIYISYIISNCNSFMESGIYVWDCVYHILCCAFRYKIHKTIILLSVMIFISGLLITILYPFIVKCDFQNIVFTVMTRWT